MFMTGIATYFYRKDHSSVFPHNFLSSNSPQTIFTTRRVRIQNFELALVLRLQSCTSSLISRNINQSLCLSELAGK